MKIAVFVTGWNKEYLRYLYGGLVNAQNKFGDEIDIYTCYAKLGSGNSVDKSEFSFFKLANLKEYDGIIFPSTTVKEGDIKNKMIEWIIPNAQKNSMEPVRLTLKPGGSSDTHLPHAGEEFGYVLKGTVRVFYGGRTYTVRAGESFYFQAGKKHRLENNGNRDAILIWVSTPPSF
mgnify:CR=1 FL=1